MKKMPLQAELRQQIGNDQVIFRTIVKGQFQVWKGSAGLIGASMSGDLFHLLPEALQRQVVKVPIATCFSRPTRRLLKDAMISQNRLLGAD